jgi:hypothetical protein
MPRGIVRQQRVLEGSEACVREPIGTHTRCSSALHRRLQTVAFSCIELRVPSDACDRTANEPRLSGRSASARACMQRPAYRHAVPLARKCTDRLGLSWASSLSALFRSLFASRLLYSRWKSLLRAWRYCWCWSRSDLAPAKRGSGASSREASNSAPRRCPRRHRQGAILRSHRAPRTRQRTSPSLDARGTPRANPSVVRAGVEIFGRCQSRAIRRRPSSAGVAGF